MTNNDTEQTPAEDATGGITFDDAEALLASEEAERAAREAARRSEQERRETEDITRAVGLVVRAVLPTANNRHLPAKERVRRLYAARDSLRGNSSSATQQVKDLELELADLREQIKVAEARIDELERDLAAKPTSHRPPTASQDKPAAASAPQRDEQPKPNGPKSDQDEALERLAARDETAGVAPERISTRPPAPGTRQRPVRDGGK